jgi:hypothetical protein
MTTDPSFRLELDMLSDTDTDRSKISSLSRPGIGISPIADMDADQTIVTAALAAEEQRRDAEEGVLGSSLGSHSS